MCFHIIKWNNMNWPLDSNLVYWVCGGETISGMTRAIPHHRNINNQWIDVRYYTQNGPNLRIWVHRAKLN